VTEPVFIVDTKRHLPHKQLTDCVLFITWRLAFSLPEMILQELALQRSNYLKEIKSSSEPEQKDKAIELRCNQFRYVDNWLDKYGDCQHNLSTNPYRGIITNTIKHDERNKYKISAFCIMPNHVHLIIKPLCRADDSYHTLTDITSTLKSVTAHKINQALQLRGKLWQDESYDRIMRDEKEYLETCEYVINNPVKAGFVKKWEDWAGTFLSDDLQ
jgi:putative transposase